MTKIDGFFDLPQFITEGTAELTHGIDDTRTSTIMNVLSSTSNLRNALSLTPGTGTSGSYAAGYAFLRYLAKQGAEHYPTSGSLSSDSANLSVAYKEAAESGAVSVSSNLLTVSKDFKGTEIDLTKYASTVEKVDATALAKGVEIIGNKNANSIAAGVGNDTLSGGTGKDTLSGGEGNESAMKAVTYTNKSSAKVTLASDVTVGDASARTKAIKIAGNARDNFLVGGKGNDSLSGGNEVDTLFGGKGNDTLYGGAGADTFIYASGEGKDVISGFDNSDMLQITGTFSGTYNKSKKEIYFKVDSTASAITLKGFTATGFNVNDTVYKISGTKLVKK